MDDVIIYQCDNTSEHYFQELWSRSVPKKWLRIWRCCCHNFLQNTIQKLLKSTVPICSLRSLHLRGIFGLRVIHSFIERASQAITASPISPIRPLLRGHPLRKLTKNFLDWIGDAEHYDFTFSRRTYARAISPRRLRSADALLRNPEKKTLD